MTKIMKNLFAIFLITWFQIFAWTIGVIVAPNLTIWTIGAYISGAISMAVLYLINKPKPEIRYIKKLGYS